MELVLSTNNKGKLREISAMLPGYILHTPESMGYTTPVPEPYHTFEENALTKAATLHRFSNLAAMADDSGICIEALGGAPGVNSAYFAGTPTDDEANLQRVLRDLDGVKNRRAWYKAVICLILDDADAPYFFEGICYGNITLEKQGSGGFGYDPVFMPDGYSETFASLPPDVKNTISHRGKAVQAMVRFLKEKFG